MDKQKSVNNIIKARKEREKEYRINSIIQSAKKVFFKKGYLKATMEEIAQGAEITKPTIYQYFKNKEDLFFSLMTPVIDDIGIQLGKIQKKLDEGEYKSGEAVLRAMFRAFYHSYEFSPETFRIIQIFQQTNLALELSSEFRKEINHKGRSNFELGRKILSDAMERGLINRANTYTLADLIWGLTVGVIQLEDIKGDEQLGHRFKRSALNLAQEFFIKAMTAK